MALHEVEDLIGLMSNSNQNKTLCSADCKYDRKEKFEDKKLDLVKCSYCTQPYHVDYADLNTGSFNDVWPCYTCRLVPSQVNSMQIVMKSIVTTLQKSIDTSSKTLDFITKKCESLENENKGLHERIDILNKQLQQKSTHCCMANNETPKLLLGDSLIKDVDESKLHGTEVVSLQGAKVSDILQGLNQKEGPYQQIYICAGTNDCATCEFDGEKVTKTYKDLIEVATKKVPSVNNVTISSIPPRCDDSEAQGRIEVINANLSSLATDTGAVFVNHDCTFKLQDGTPNDGYLVNDGPLLTTKGTNKVINNLKIPSKASANGNVCKSKSSRATNNPSVQVMTNDHKWQVVRNRKQSQSSRSRQERRNDESATQAARCWNCYETNHVARACRFSSPVTCYGCGESGHKRKFCTFTAK